MQSDTCRLAVSSLQTSSGDGRTVGHTYRYSKVVTFPTAPPPGSILPFDFHIIDVGNPCSIVYQSLTFKENKS